MVPWLWILALRPIGFCYDLPLSEFIISVLFSAVAVIVLRCAGTTGAFQVDQRSGAISRCRVS